MTTPSDDSQAVELPPLPGFLSTNLCAAMQEWCAAEEGDAAGEAFEHVVRRFNSELRTYGHAAIAQDRAARAQGVREAVAWMIEDDTGDLRKAKPGAEGAFPVYRSPQAAEVPGSIGFSPMWHAPIDGTPVLLYLPTTGAKFAVGQFHSDGPDTICGFWGDDEGARYVHEPARWMGLHVLKRLAAAPTPTASTPKADHRCRNDVSECKRAACAVACQYAHLAPKAEGEASRIPFAGYDPKFCPGSNPDNPQEWPDDSQPPGEADRTRASGDVDSEGASHV